MSIGKRIRFFRKRAGMTQEQLGRKIGITNQSANIRIAQYEWNRRTPKEELIGQIAEAFDVSPAAVNIPTPDSYEGLMHTLFSLEDEYGLTVTVLDGEICLKQDVNHPNFDQALATDISQWNEMKMKLTTGSIWREDYDHWRYHYPDDLAEEERKRPEPGEASMVKEDPILYTEEDIMRMLKMYRERK